MLLDLDLSALERRKTDQLSSSALSAQLILSSGGVDSKFELVNWSDIDMDAPKCQVVCLRMNKKEWCTDVRVRWMVN